MDKMQQLKNLVAQIDMSPIVSYLQASSPKSNTLKRTIKCYKKVQASQDAAEVFKMTVQLAYFLDTIVNKTNYAKDETEKQKCREISRELFANTVGIK